MQHDKVTKAKVQLILSQPFFATLALSMKFIEDNTIETACTDGESIRYNSEFINSLDVEKTKGLIAHEVMHVASLHHTRRNGRDADKWNIACDYAINQLLKDSGFTLPEGGLINPAYKNKSSEEIYKLLPDQPKDKNNQGNGNSGGGKNSDPGKCGGVSDAPAKTQTEMQQKEAEAKQLVAQAATVARQQGKLPAHLERLIGEVMQARVNWKDVLNNFITEITRNDYTFSFPSKRYLSQGLYLPSLRSIEKGKFIFIVDTSGSVWSYVQLLESIFSEMQSILSEIAETITVYYVDTKIHGEPIEYESDEMLNMNPIGGGGTDFKPAFDHITKNGIEAAAIVYFTDGYCNSFPTDPGIPTLWATYENKNFSPPFGEVVKID